MDPIISAIVQKLVSGTVQSKGPKYCGQWLDRQPKQVQKGCWLSTVTFFGLFGLWLHGYEMEGLGIFMWAFGGFLCIAGLLNYFICPKAIASFRETMREPEADRSRCPDCGCTMLPGEKECLFCRNVSKRTPNPPGNT